MGFGIGKIIAGTMSASFAAGQAIAGSMERGMDRQHMRHEERAEKKKLREAGKLLQSDEIALRTGYLYPSDYAGADIGGLMDYRGLEWPERLQDVLSGGIVTLGKLKNPRTGFEEQCTLPWDVFNTHTAIIAPTGSGKTYGIVIPWIIMFAEAGGRVIANDVKGDLCDEVLSTIASYSGTLPIIRWNPMNKRASQCWNPLHEVCDDHTRTQLVTALLGDIGKANSQDKFFLERDHRWLRGFIKLALAIDSNTTFHDIYRLLSDFDSLANTIQINASICGEINEISAMAPYEYSLAIGSIMNKLEWLTYSNARYVTKKSDFSLKEVIDTPGILMIGSDISKGDPAFAAASMMFAMLQSRTFQRPSGTGLENAWIIDESAFLASRISLDNTLALARSKNLGIAISQQDVTQFGNEEAQNKYLANCKTFITLRDVSDATAQFFSKRLGMHTVEKVTSSIANRGYTTPQISVESVPILRTSEIMHPPSDFGRFCGIVHAPTLGTNKPFIVDFGR
jgi:type IV secretory pathway TraG/TraD family ATPase VirD4